MERDMTEPERTGEIHEAPAITSLAQVPGKLWGWIMAYGALLLLFALVVILNPSVAGFATGLLLGIVLVLYGVAGIVSGVTSMAHRARWLEVLLGIVALVAGLFSLFNPLAGALSVVWAIGFWLLVAGTIQIVWAFRAGHDRGWRFFLGAIDLILGLVLLFSSPSLGLAILAVIIMVSFALRGIFLILLASTLRKASRIN